MDLVGSRGGIHNTAVGVSASRAYRLTAGLSPRFSRSSFGSFQGYTAASATAKAGSSPTLWQQETSAEPGEGYRAPLPHDPQAIHRSATPAAEGASVSAQGRSNGAINVPARETVA
jgi:hypothetical protein